MPRPPTTCTHPGCLEVATDGHGRCTPHQRRAPDTRPGPRERGYGGAHETRFRPGVLRRDPWCVDPDHVHDQPVRATVADHHPRTRRELVLAGDDPDDPRHGRGLCAPCHSRITAADPRTASRWGRGLETG